MLTPPPRPTGSISRAEEIEELIREDKPIWAVVMGGKVVKIFPRKIIGAGQILNFAFPAQSYAIQSISLHIRNIGVAEPNNFKYYFANYWHAYAYLLHVKEARVDWDNWYNWYNYNQASST